jgi:hypothetical protein
MDHPERRRILEGRIPALLRVKQEAPEFGNAKRSTAVVQNLRVFLDHPAR